MTGRPVVPNLLRDDEFQRTFGVPMRNVTGTATDVIDIWPYVAAVPAAHLAGHSVCDGNVEAVYRTPDDHYDHVLVVTHTKNVFLVVVIDLVQDRIYGHHLLDLNEKYGLR